MHEPAEHIYCISDKNFIITLLLCLFFGYLGIHRFYTGKVGTGILMLITCGLGGIWVIIDFILILLGIFKDKEGLPIRF
jgi:TM2 domain-containing membrane protein YozV